MALDLPDMTARLRRAHAAVAAPRRHRAIHPRLDELVLRELDVALIAPTHGLPISDPRATLPRIREGLRLGGRA